MFLLGAPPALVKLTALGCRMVPNREKILSYGQMVVLYLLRTGDQPSFVPGVCSF